MSVLKQLRRNRRNLLSPFGHGSHLCVEERQTPDGVEGDQHLHQKLFMFCFQRQSETIDYTAGGETSKKSKHSLIMNT